MRRFGLLAAVLLGSVATAAPQEIPALIELSPEVAAAHADLVAQRASLVQERGALHARFDQHNQRCTNIDPENKTTISDCAHEREELVVALKAHIARSESFNCSQVPFAQEEFIRFREQVATDQQILQNFGFSQTVNDMESWEEYGKEAQKKFIERAKQRALGKTLEYLQLKVKSIEAPPPVGGAEADAYRRLFESAGVKDQRLLNDLRAAALGQKRVQVWRVTEKLEGVTKVIELIDEPQDLTDQISTTLTVASLVAPEIAPALSVMEDANWIGYAAYSVGREAYGLHEVDKLTTLTEVQLKELTSFTQKLKRDVDSLHAARKVLEWPKTANCGTPPPTNLHSE